MHTVKLFSNQTLTQTLTLILIPKKQNEKIADEYFLFSLYSLL